MLHVNSVYPEIEPVSDFIAAVRAWRCGRPVDDRHPAFVEATTSRQLLYSTLDILGRALGGLAELRVEAPSAVTASGDVTYRPFADLPGTLAGLPFYLRLQTYLERDDHDHHSLAMHRLAVGGPEGTIALAHSFGPVVRSRPLFLPGYGRTGSVAEPDEGFATDPDLRAATASADRLAAPSTRAAVEDVIPRAVGRAIGSFAQAIRAGASPPAQAADHLALVARAWLLVNQQAGRPALRSLAPPRPPGTLGLTVGRGSE